MKCEIEVNYCEEFDYNSGFCTKCSENAYLTNEHCCPLRTYYNTTTGECTNISGVGLE